MKENLSLLTVLAVLSISLPAQGQPWLGSGTEGDPYLIEDANDMQAIGANPNHWDAHFIMVNDINLAEYTGTQFNIIGNDSNAFTGVFDGNGHSIFNFTYVDSNADYLGLFGKINDPNAEVKDLILVRANIVGNTGGAELGLAGAIVGGLSHGALIRCRVDHSNISGWYGTGGLVGRNSRGTIFDSSFTGTVQGLGPWDVGGLAGLNYHDGVICNCYARGIVSGATRVGGLIGNNCGTISNCYAMAVISGTDYDAGGLVGSHVGSGIVISNCYATGEVSGTYRVGGLIGYNNGTIMHCYALGAVDGNDYIGGLIGYSSEMFYSHSRCFWDTSVNPHINGIGNTSDPNVIAKSTAEMKQKATFGNWDFLETWGIEDNQTYPFLRLTYPLGDHDLDKDVDFLDFAIFADHWLAGVE